MTYNISDEEVVRVLVVDAPLIVTCVIWIKILSLKKRRISSYQGSFMDMMSKCSLGKASLTGEPCDSEDRYVINSTRIRVFTTHFRMTTHETYLWFTI